MPARLLVIGLDATESSLVDAGIARGDLPAFAALDRESARFALGNSLDSLPGAIWPEINTGRAAESRALFFHPDQIHTGEAIPRPVDPGSIDPGEDWWNVAGAHGRRVLVIDAPQSVPARPTNGINVADWGTHDRTWTPVAEPPEALGDAERIVGRRAIDTCDAFVRDGHAERYRELRARLLHGVEQRTRLTETLMDREHWDVAHVVFSETHCAGHHFWALCDDAGPVGVFDAPAELRDALDAVYRAVDAGLARLVEAAGPDARIAVVASHGMGPYVGGYQLVPELLTRLGLRRDTNGAATFLTRRAPDMTKSLARRFLTSGMRTRVRRTVGIDAHHDLRLPGTAATVVPNNRCAAIRLNVRGREPDGRLEPGAEVDAVLDRLRCELRALTDPRTGEPIVRRISTPHADDGPDVHPDVPDMTVAFRTDLGPLEACDSPTVGRIVVPLWPRRRARDWPLGLGRTGDHTDASTAWLPGPPSGARPGPASPTASVLDLTPTFLRLLDVPIPEELRGRPLVESTAPRVSTR